MNPLQVRETTAYDVDKLQELVGIQAIDRLRVLVRKLHKEFGHDAIIWHINSSGVGGGVADILNSLVPFSSQLGVTTRWIVIGGDENFFKVTKKFHNALQGSSEVSLDDKMLAHYHTITRNNARQIGQLIKKNNWTQPDVVVLHDPQPIGLISCLRSRYPDALFVWRGHIQFDMANWGLSHPGRRVWEMLVGLINQCDAAIFHLPEQVPPGIKIPVHFILPSINPLAHINRDLSGPEASRFIHSTLSKYGLEKLQDLSTPLVLQNARFDPWKDHPGVIQAFRETQRRLPANCNQPNLLLVGPIAGDDPEAHDILAKLKHLQNGDGAVHILPIFPGENGATPGQRKALRELGVDHRQLGLGDLMELEINAFQTRADIVVAKSLREGFGLTVTGAGYHGKPRIVSQVGGISAQVSDGTAFQVGGTPNFSRDVSIAMTRDSMIRLLRSPRLRKSIGAKAKRHVIRNFLPQRHLQDYFRLFLELRIMKKS